MGIPEVMEASALVEVLGKSPHPYAEEGIWSKVGEEAGSTDMS